MSLNKNPPQVDLYQITNSAMSFIENNFNVHGK